MNIKDKVLNSNIPLVWSVGRIAYDRFLEYVNRPARFQKVYKSQMDDKQYISELFYQRFGYEMPWDNPSTFNEKANWRKLYDRNPKYTERVDKLQLKRVVTEECGEGHVVPLLGSWDNPKAIDISNLPEKFVLKANHAGGVIVCKDKRVFDLKKAKKELGSMLRKDYSLISREWPYKNVPRKILAEEYIGDNLTDYKNYCFNGKAMYTFVWENVSREDGRKPAPFFCGAYDRKWEKTTIDIDYPKFNKIENKPEGYETMIRIAERLSIGIPFVRVDCFIVSGKVYIGEMTFFPWGGYQKFIDDHWNQYLGNMIDLPLVNKNM